MIGSGKLEVAGVPRECVREEFSGGERRVTLTLPPDAPRAEAAVKLHFRYPREAFKLDVWTAAAGFPANLCSVCQRRITYGDCTHGTVLPVLSLLDHEAKRGESIVIPPGSEPGGLFYFDLDDYFGAGVAVVFAHVRLDPGKTVELRVLLAEHEDCYRPILKYLVENHPDHFYPALPEVWRDRGPFVMTNPDTADRLLDDAASRGAKWSEIHNHFPHYGNYAPEEPEWVSVVSHDYPELPVRRISVGKINGHIGRLHARGISAMLYIQCGGDAFKPWICKAFPEAVVRKEDGRDVPTWKECILAFDDGRSAYSAWVGKMIERFLENYPDIDGVFFDQLCYNTLDCAHDDGRCAAEGGAPAAMTGSGYRHGAEMLMKALHPRGKRIWANGPFNLAAAKYADGIMAEGVSGTALVLKYLCLKKPLLVHAYCEKPEIVEALMKSCLLSGGSWSLGGSSKLPDPGPYSPEVEALFSAYLPLIRPLENAELFLAPHPFAPPAGFQGEIFRDKTDGKLFVTLIGSSLLKQLKLAVSGFVPARVRYRSTDRAEWCAASAAGQEITLPGGSCAYLVEITPGDVHLSVSIPVLW